MCFSLNNVLQQNISSMDAGFILAPCGLVGAQALGSHTQAWHGALWANNICPRNLDQSEYFFLGGGEISFFWEG